MTGALVITDPAEYYDRLSILRFDPTADNSDFFRDLADEGES
jgi:hypothetical protein